MHTLAAWKALQKHHETVKDQHLRQLFAEDPRRGDRLTAEAAGVYLDYSNWPTRRLSTTAIVRSRSALCPNVDGTDFAKAVRDLDPAATLFIVSSKTFTRLETMTNSRTARDWLLAAMKGDEYAIARHFVAVWTNAQEMPKFGIDTANLFGFWDWVGGRYSMDSAIGFSTMLAIGPRDTRAMLGGFDEMDEHFRSAPFERDLPVLMGLLAIWYNNLWRPNDRGAALRAISQALSGLFAATDHGEHGKHVTLDRAPRGLRYGPIYWGEPGTNGQHSFYQLMHLGTRDFIAFAHALNPLARHHDMLLANVFAQTETLAFGKTAEEVKAERTPGWLLPHQLFEGNRPSNALLLEALTPAALGTSQRVSLPSAPCASNTAFLRVATCLEPSINPQKAQQAW